MTGILLQAMLNHPSWSDVKDLTALPANPLLERSEIIRDLRADIPSTRDSLLIVLYSADRSDWRLDSLLSRSARQGVATVLIEGHEPLMSSTMALARRLKLPVVGTANTLSTQRAFVRLSQEHDLESANLTLQVLAHAARADSDVEDLLQRVSSVVGRPIALLDAEGTHLAGDKDSSHELRERIPRDRSTTPGGMRLELPSEGLLLAHPLRPAGGQAWLTVRLPTVVATEVEALESVMRAITPAVELRLLLARVELERDTQRRASVLAELLQQPVTIATRRRALELGWELDGWHTGIHIGVGTQVDLTDRRTEVTAAFDAEDLHTVVVEHRDGWTAWITSTNEPTPVEVQTTAAAIRRAHRRLQRTLDSYVGVGRPHIGPEGIAESITEASDAAHLARGRPESGQFLHVDRLGLAQLLLAWTETDTFQPAALSLLEPLANASGELLTTLAAYLDAESSLTETAAVLGVHRNTVSGRISRIESMLGVDLSVPDDRLALHLACRTALRTRDSRS